ISVVLAALAMVWTPLAYPQAEWATAQTGRPEAKKIADDLYFFFEYSGSNAVFLVTNDGVLLIDTRTHPREGRDLLDRIRKITDKPIRWVINSHFHGDHNFGNVVFKQAG